MRKISFPEFIGGSYTLDSLDAAVQRTVNLYPEKNESGGGIGPSRLRGTPGLTTLVTLTSGNEIKALFYDTFTARAFAVVRRSTGSIRLVEFNLSGTETDRGELVASGGDLPASISSNGTQLFIVEPGAPKAWIFTLATNALTDETAGIGAGAPIWGAFLDSYFIALDSNGRFYLSALNDGTTWDALDFGTAISSPDKTRTLIADHGELWLFGDDSIEVWFNSGNADFPFEPISGATISHGILFKYTVQVLDNSLYWVGRGRSGKATVWRTDGYRPERISDHAVEKSIQDIGTITGQAPVAWTYQEHGHSFYNLTFPDNNLTWSFDATTERWHQRMYLNGSTEEAHRGRCFAFVGGEEGAAAGLVIGDRDNGKLYTMALSNFDDAGDRIRRIRRGIHLNSMNHRTFYGSLELLAEVGSDQSDQLDGALNNSATTVTVDSTAGFLSAGTILIDSEMIAYTGTGATTFTGCTRGSYGTTAASHLDNAAVSAVSEFNLEISDDRGHTFDSPLVARAAALAEYTAELQWNRLGSARDRVFQVYSDAPMRHSWQDAFLEVEAGRH